MPSEFVAEPIYNPWGEICLGRRSAIEADIRTSYFALRDKAVSRREKELLSASKRPVSGKSRKVVESTPLVRPPVGSSGVAVDTPVTSVPSGSSLRKSDSLAKRLIRGEAPISRGLKVPSASRPSPVVVSSNFPTEPVVSSAVGSAQVSAAVVGGSKVGAKSGKRQSRSSASVATKVQSKGSKPVKKQGSPEIGGKALKKRKVHVQKLHSSDSEGAK